MSSGAVSWLTILSIFRQTYHRRTHLLSINGGEGVLTALMLPSAAIRHLVLGARSGNMGGMQLEGWRLASALPHTE